MGHSHSIKEYPGQIAGIAALSAAVGAAAAVLFTPRRGAELRRGLGRRAGGAKDTLMDKVHSKQAGMAAKAEDMKETGKDKTIEAAERAKSAADKTKDRADR